MSYLLLSFFASLSVKFLFMFGPPPIRIRGIGHSQQANGKQRIHGPKVNGPLAPCPNPGQRESPTRDNYARALRESPIQGILAWILSLFLWFVGHQWAWACGVIVFGWIGVCLGCFGLVLGFPIWFNEWWGPP